MQINNVFKAKLIIYALNKDKYSFAGSLYDNTLYINQRVMEKQIFQDSNKVYKYNLFIEILQNKFVFKEICQVNVGNRYLAIKQHNNQFVTQLIGYLNFLEEQLNFKIQNKICWIIFLKAYHDYLKQALILQNQLSTIHLELEKAFSVSKELKLCYQA